MTYCTQNVYNCISNDTCILEETDIFNFPYPANFKFMASINLSKLGKTGITGIVFLVYF